MLVLSFTFHILMPLEKIVLHPYFKIVSHRNDKSFPDSTRSSALGKGRRHLVQHLAQ
jgi:hypothetical protein